MWKIYRPCPIFDRELRPHLKLPDQKKGSLNAWFGETVSLKRKAPHHPKRLARVGFIQCDGLGICVKKYTYVRLSCNPIWRYKRVAKVKYDYHKKLFDLGIPVPEPYACLYEYDSYKDRISTYTIHQKLESMHTLFDFWGEEHFTMKERQEVLSRLGLYNIVEYANEIFSSTIDAGINR